MFRHNLTPFVRKCNVNREDSEFIVCVQTCDTVSVKKKKKPTHWNQSVAHCVLRHKLDAVHRCRNRRWEETENLNTVMCGALEEPTNTHTRTDTRTDTRALSK